MFAQRRGLDAEESAEIMMSEEDWNLSLGSCG
jgi:hypothetical protein